MFATLKIIMYMISVISLTMQPIFDDELKVDIRKKKYRDDTRMIQDKINNLTFGEVLDGGNIEYVVTTLWLKSNMTMQNFRLKTKAGNTPDITPISIGNDLATENLFKTPEAMRSFKISAKYPGHQNIILRNVHVDGNRINQTNLKLRDGGRHGFCIKGYASKILIENSSASNCATDGILIYRGLNTERFGDTPVCSKITIKGFGSRNNRRHGGAGDSIKDFICENSTFENNGNQLLNSLREGANAALYLGKGYGTGWDMEGYGIGSNIENIIFKKCKFLRNAAMGISIYDPVDQNEIHFKQRKNINILNCEIDGGRLNTLDGFCISISSTIAAKSNPMKLYKTINIDSCRLYGKILLRSCDKIKITNTDQVIIKKDVTGVLDNVSNIFTKNFSSNATRWEAFKTSFSYFDFPP